MGADTVNFNEFNTTVFEQISNSYQKFSESTISTETTTTATTVAPTPTDDETAPPGSEANPEDLEGDYDEYDNSESQSGSPAATVSN